MKSKKVLISLLFVGFLAFTPVYAQTTEELTQQLNGLIQQLIALLMEQIKILQTQLVELQAQQNKSVSAINQIIPIIVATTTPTLPTTTLPTIPPYNPPIGTPSAPLPETPITPELIVEITTSTVEYSYSKDTISRNWILPLASFEIKAAKNPNHNYTLIKSLAFIKNNPSLEVKNLQVLFGSNRFGKIKENIPENEVIIFTDEYTIGESTSVVAKLWGSLSIDSPVGIYTTPFELNNGNAYSPPSTTLWPNPVKGQNITISQ